MQGFHLQFNNKSNQKLQT